MAGEVDHRPDLRLALGLGVLMSGAVGGLVAWSWSVEDRLPDPVARHWGGSGVANGFSSLSSTLWVMVGLVIVVVTPLLLASVFARQPTALRRCLAATAAWLVVFTTVLVADSLRGQLDLADAAEAPAPGVGALVGVVVGLLAAVALGALVRDDRRAATAAGPPPDSAPRRPSGPDGMSWRARESGLDRGVALGGIVVGGGFGVAAVIVSWWLWPVAVFMLALSLGFGRVTTVVDAEGLRAEMLGIRILHVPVAEVAEADVVDVDPFWEFGGWGLRVDVAGRTGLVTRKGPALRVRRGDGSETLVTVAGADVAAATLNALADRYQGLPGPQIDPA